MLSVFRQIVSTESFKMADRETLIMDPPYLTFLMEISALFPLHVTCRMCKLRTFINTRPLFPTFIHVGDYSAAFVNGVNNSVQNS
jgi:hypothetical protein